MPIYGIAKWEEHAKWWKPHVGALAFDSDTNNSALQAADVIVWSSHRRLSRGLTNEFAPLGKIFEERFDVAGKPLVRHVDRTIPREGLQAFTNQMNTWIYDNGRLPLSLSDTVA
jgi:hypothetical protein